MTQLAESVAAAPTRVQGGRSTGVGPSREDPEAVAREIRRCRICVTHPRGAPLGHAPRPILQVGRGARLCIASQAPGTRAHAAGVPFHDPSGERLRAWLGIGPEVFYDAQRVAIVPMGFCFPGLDNNGGDRPPRPECAPLWRARMFAALPDLQLVLLIGQYAQRWHLGRRGGRTLTETVSNWRHHLSTETPAPRYLPLPHPSWRNNGWLKKNLWFEAELLPRLRQTVAQCLGE